MATPTTQLFSLGTCHGGGERIVGMLVLETVYVGGRYPKEGPNQGMWYPTLHLPPTPLRAFLEKGLNGLSEPANR